jgi:CRISPR-associated protein Cas5d
VNRLFALEVWGDFACFTRPELKVERHSYPVITPSAARGIFDSIYMHFDRKVSGRPTFRWQVRRVEVVNPVMTISLACNEVKGKVSTFQVQRWMKRPELAEPLFADGTGKQAELSGRTQRQTIALRNVRYRLFGEAVLFSENPALQAQVEGIFERRARAGQCNHQPFLGCRDFSCFFKLVEPKPGRCAPVDEEIGWMVYDLFDLAKPGSSDDASSLSLFRARVENGVLEVPAYSSDEVRKLGIGVF